MNRNKILTLALCGTMALSVSSVSVAADGVAGIKAGREKVLTAISAAVRDQTQEHVQKMSSLIKAAVQIAKTEEEARKAAEAAAAEAKAKQEKAAAEEKAKKEKEEAEERAKKEAEEAKKKAEGIEEAEPVTEAAAVEYAQEPVYYAPDYSYYQDAYYEAPVYDTLYAEPYVADAYYEDVTYTEPLYTYDAAPQETYEAETPVYEDTVYTDDSLYTDYEEPVYYDEAAYYDETYTDAGYDESYTDESNGDVYDDNSGVRAEASSSDLDLLASIIYCEAGGESYEGQVAVGAVVLNRMESSLYPDDMTDVIYQSGQFTPAMTGWLDQVRASGVPDYCYDAAQAALNGENPVGDCLYFHAGGGDGLTIGNQTFY